MRDDLDLETVRIHADFNGRSLESHAVRYILTMTFKFGRSNLYVIDVVSGSEVQENRNSGSPGCEDI
jgi:hypothetical protein